MIRNQTMLLKTNNPREAIIESYTKPISYKNYILFKGKVIVCFRQDWLYLGVKKLLLIIVIIIASLNFLYTFGYQGEPMSQLEFLSRTLGSIIILVFSIVQLNKITIKPQVYLPPSVQLFLNLLNRFIYDLLFFADGLQCCLDNKKTYKQFG